MYTLGYVIELPCSIDTISLSNERGEAFGPNRFTGIPSELQMNFAKFHCRDSPPKLSFRYLYSGWVMSPFSHSTFPKTGNDAPLERANFKISSFVPGSWLRKLLHGKARISRPESLLNKWLCSSGLHSWYQLEITYTYRRVAVTHHNYFLLVLSG